MRILVFVYCFVLSLASAQGSGSKASQSVLELGDPLNGCLLPGAQLRLDPEDAAIVTIDGPTPTQIWAVTFDQAWLEVEFDGEFFFVAADQAQTAPC